MINDNTILSSFNDRPTLLEWLKKVEEALKSDTAKSISVDNPETNVYIIKITFADGRIMYTEPIRLPDSVKGVSISNNHLVITMQSGVTDDLGVINPYAETIVSNSDTGTTEIRNNAYIGGNLQVDGNVLFGNSTISIQGTTKQNGILGTNADGKIAFKEISGGGDTNLEVYPTFRSGSGTSIQNIFNITEEERTKLLSGEINTISGLARRENGQTIPFCVSRFFFEETGPSSNPIIIARFYGTIYSDYQSTSFTLRTFETAIGNGTQDITLYIKEFKPVIGE